MPLRRFRRHYEQLSQSERGGIISMIGAGWLDKQVAGQLGRSDCVLRRYWDQLIREMSFTRKQGLGCPRGDSHIANVEPSLGAPVSSRTKLRRLAKEHLGSGCPLRVLPLTSTHRGLHLEWYCGRGNWTTTEWHQIVFSDESRFKLSSDDYCFHMWRPRGNALILHLLWRDTPFSQLVRWYGITMPTIHVHLSIDPWQHDKRAVCDDILQPRVLSLIQRLPGSIFQQDNARPHMARMSQNSTALLLPFLGLPDSQICLQSSISGIIWDHELGIP
ncbi:transposable element Tcb2 transposase [Trichonephila clavipes]|nr:transposable element Tcb2 transposase [Trichonephila clavipes]